MSETLSYCYSHMAIQCVSLLHIAQQDTINSMKNIYNGIYTILLLAIDLA